MGDFTRWLTELQTLCGFASVQAIFGMVATTVDKTLEGVFSSLLEIERQIIGTEHVFTCK